MGRWSVRNRCSFLLVLLLLQYFINKYLSFYLLTKINFNPSLMFPYTLGKDSQSIPKFINSTLTLDQKSVPSCNIIKTKVLVSHFNWKKLDQCIPSHELQLVTQKKVCWVNPQRSGEELTVETLLLCVRRNKLRRSRGGLTRRDPEVNPKLAEEIIYHLDWKHSYKGTGNYCYCPPPPSTPAE